MREGTYKTTDGRLVHYTDGDTVKLATDLYQYVEHDYKGSVSVDATRLEEIVKDLQAGKPLQGAEWDILAELQQRLGSDFERWRAEGKDGQGATVPQGAGRMAKVQEAIETLPDALLRWLKESDSYRTDSASAKDRRTTPPHLLDGALHDFAHAKQHADRLLAPDVRSDPQSTAFNHEHMIKHLVSGIDHLSRMGKHLEQFASDPKVFAGERQALHTLRESSASPPPNLREAPPHDEATENARQVPVKECGTCKMFDCGRCWGYGNIRVGEDWLCDSWTVAPDWKAQNAAADSFDLVRLAEAAQLKQDVAIDKQSSMVASPEHPSPTVCVDFDGVLHKGPHGLPGRVGGELIDGAEQGLRKLKAMGYRIVVLTARVDLEAVRDWLKSQGLEDLITEVTNRKPAASAYIDDRATHFTDWPTAVKAVDPLTPVQEKPQVKESSGIALRAVIALPRGILED